MKRHTMSQRLVIVWIALASICSAAADTTVRVVEAEHSLSVEHADEKLWSLHYNPAEGKPYLHPLAASDGTVFTDLRPEDHPWHRGMWFSWKYINGVNYWEEDRTTGRSEGQTRLLRTTHSVDQNQIVQIRHQLEYAPGSGADAVLAEERSLRITAPDSRGVYQIDWVSEFRALEAVTLDRTPLVGQPNGKSYGGYAGLSIRMNSEVRGGEFVNASDGRNKVTHGQCAEWMRFESNSGASLLFLNDPHNFRSPPKWYVAPGMPYFSPAPLFDAPHTLAAGETLTLNYRVIVSPTLLSHEASMQAYTDWLESSAK